MKIAIVSSNLDSLALFKFLNKYDHEYVIYCDALNAPYEEKSLKSGLHFAKNALARAKEQAVDKVILPPLLELALLQKGVEYGFQTDDLDLILPLFSQYLLKEVFPYSLVGKLGIFGPKASLEDAQLLIAELSHSYSPRENQLAIKKFSFPFHFWSKDTRIFSHLLEKIGWKSFLVNSVIKHDLRYFKDAAVDTVIPLNYAYFHAEVTISKFFNFRKIRFHRLDKLEQCFQSLIGEGKTSEYRVKIYATDTLSSLWDNKRLVWLLQRGKMIEIELLN